MQKRDWTVAPPTDLSATPLHPPRDLNPEFLTGAVKPESEWIVGVYDEAHWLMDIKCKTRRQARRLAKVLNRTPFNAASIREAMR